MINEVVTDLNEYAPVERITVLVELENAVLETCCLRCRPIYTSSLNPSQNESCVKNEITDLKLKRVGFRKQAAMREPLVTGILT